MAGLPCQGLLGIVRITLNWVILVLGKGNWERGNLGFLGKFGEEGLKGGYFKQGN